ncbi:FAD-dependent oxidoreductase [Colwelliaceae bacterium BS250]
MNRSAFFKVIIAAFIVTHLNVFGTPFTPPTKNRIVEESKSLQIAYDVDLVVAGGSIQAVTTAVHAAQNGASVFLLTDRPYLGEDMGLHMKYQLKGKSVDPILKDIWGDNPKTTPLTLKKNLDKLMLDAGVQYLTGSYPAEILLDEKGQFSGITMVNRSGRQVVKAKVLVDATEHATLMRQLTVPFSDFNAGPIAFNFRSAGGELNSISSKKTSETIPSVGSRGTFKAKANIQADIYETDITHQLKQASWSEIAKIEQKIRNQISRKGIVETSEALDYHLGIHLNNGNFLQSWPGTDKVNLHHFYHNDFPDMLIYGKYAAIDAKIYKNISLADKVKLSHKLADHARSIAKKKTQNNSFIPVKHKASPSYAMAENNKVLNSADKKQFVDIKGNSLPILGEYDVVVVGGGTSGAPAALAAAEKGAKTLLIEYLDELGGVGTAGLIGKYWYGLRNGFTARIDKAIKSGKRGWDVYEKSEWLRRNIGASGGDIWYRSFGSGAVMQGNKVKGVIVATPFGRGIVLAKTVIDGTGNSDISSHAGASTRFSIDEKGMFSVQIAGYPYRNPGNNYNNTAYALVDDTDAIDIWHLMMSQRQKGSDKFFDAGQLVDSRERRRIVGDYTLTTIDILAARTFEDTIVQMKSNFDAAGFPNSPLLLVKDMKGPVYTANMPYRSFLPSGLRGIYTIGLGASAERDAMTLVRMQPDMQNQGYAIGMAAAMAADLDGNTRDVNIKALQKSIIKKGIMPANVYGAKDSFPVSQAIIATAIVDIKDMKRQIDQKRSHVSDYTSLAYIMSNPEVSMPLLRKAYKNASEDLHKINYARVMAFLNDQTGKDVLVKELNSKDWDKGHGWTKDREHKNTFTDVDRLILALTYCDGQSVTQAIHKKIQELTPEHTLSHYLAVSYAFRKHPSKALQQKLITLLDSEGFSGHAQHYQAKMTTERKETDKSYDNNLNKAMKELTVAGMLINAGDKDKRGAKVIEQYQHDFSGHFRRYAESLLNITMEK